MAKPKTSGKTKSRIRREIAETARDLAEGGLMSFTDADKITARMLGPDAVPPAARLTPADIQLLRERERMSQAVFARLLDVTVSTLSKWERGEASPRGPARRLLHVIKAQGARVVLSLGV